MVSLALNIIPDGPIEEVIELVQVAEDSGYSTCRLYDEGLATHDVYVVSSAVALATSNMLVGPGITNPFTRHPGQTAVAHASLAELSGGRAVAGFGAGGSLTLDALGLSRSRPVVSLRELIRVCRGLWSGEQVDFEGETVRLHQATMARPYQDIPIWLAGRGPRVLTLGGELADGVILDFLHETTLSASVDTVRKGAAISGNSVDLSYSTSIVMTDGDLEAVRPHMTYRLCDSPTDIREQIGMTDEDVERIRNAMADGLHVAAQYVSDDWVLPFVIHGTDDECRAQLTELVETHMLSEFMIPVFEMQDQRDYVERVGRLFDHH